jgi:hypothetical protein
MTPKKISNRKDETAVILSFLIERSQNESSKTAGGILGLRESSKSQQIEPSAMHAMYCYIYP